MKRNSLLSYSSIFGVKNSLVSTRRPVLVQLSYCTDSKHNKSGPAKPACNENIGEGSKGKTNDNYKYMLIAFGITTFGALIIGYNNGLFNKKDSSTQKPKSSRIKRKVPSSSSEIPKHVPYLLIGGGTASFSAFRAIKSLEPKAKVMVITNELEIPYMRPPLSKELWFNTDNKSSDILKFKQWNGVERSLFYEPNDFYVSPMSLLSNENGGVAVIRGYNVKKIDVCSKKAILDDDTEISYDECLIATGSAPSNLEVFEKAPQEIRDKISVFKTIEDYENLRGSIPKFSSITIVGGGFLGSELACALAKYENHKKLKVYQVFCEDGNMSKVLPKYLSDWTTKRVEEEGVNVMPNTNVKSVEKVGKQLKLSFTDGRSLLTDHIVVAVGSKPNTDLGHLSKLEIDERLGGYVVNAELEARRHVYVAGDAACFYDPQLGRRRVEHHDHAVVSGRLAGENMTGLKKPYTHQSMFWSDLGPNVGYEAIGLVDSSLPTTAIFVKSQESKNDNEERSVEQKESTKCDPNTDQYDKGVIFYLKKNKVVGILLWNVFNRIGLARKIISEDKEFEDLNEVAKLFDIHNQSQHDT